jgi:hypothetical protein
MVPRTHRPRAAATFAAPVGVQPEDGGRLQCLECGREYRNLGVHVTKTHDLSGEHYRRRHELPAGRRLVAADLLAQAAARAREQYPANHGLRTGPDERTRARSLQQARETREESASRIGSRLAMARRMALRSENIRRRTLDRYDELARACGYGDLGGMLSDTATLRESQVAALLGVSTSTAGRLRAEAFSREGVTDPRLGRAAQIRRGTLQRYGERARLSGYASLAELVAAVTTLAGIAELLEVSVQTACRLRQSHRALVSRSAGPDDMSGG